MPQPPLVNDRFHAASADEANDTREFEAFAHAQDPLDIEAATWVARRRNGLDAQGEAELADWLAADPRHVEAFEDMEATFGDVQQLPDDDVATLKANLSDRERSAAPTSSPVSDTSVQPRQPRTPTPPNLGRRAWLLGWLPLIPQAIAATIAFVAVGGAWMGWEHWWQQPTFAQAYATERGQQLAVTLLDDATTGSTLHLDTATRLEARLYRDRREIHLREGQALFTVKSDAERPFHVRAGALRITVIGTRFSVRHTTTGLDAGHTVVNVEEGRVRLARVSANGQILPATHTDLIAGDRVSANAQGQLGPVAGTSTSAIAAWRDGRISFEQTPLADAIAEFDRYGRTGLVVRDPAVAALPVGGSYSLRQFHRFAETLPQVLPVRLVRRGDVTEVVAR
jgi:transmembrane sensor